MMPDPQREVRFSGLDQKVMQRWRFLRSEMHLTNADLLWHLLREAGWI